MIQNTEFKKQEDITTEFKLKKQWIIKARVESNLNQSKIVEK